MQALGLGAGTFTDLGFNVSTKLSSQPYNNFTIKISCTTLDQLPTTFITAGARIAVAPSDPNVVYFEAIGGGGIIHKSTDSGLTFSVMKVEGTGTAAKLEDGMNTAVSTRAAIQALGEGFANYMRQEARGDAAVISRLNGILLQGVETNKQLQVLADQQFDEKRAKVNQIKADYAVLKAQGKNDVKSVQDVTIATSAFIELDPMKFQ